MIRPVSEITQPIKREIDLTGPQGNAFCLLGHARQLAHQLELDADKIDEEMRESDYENMIGVFDKYFGNFVDLFR